MPNNSTALDYHMDKKTFDGILSTRNKSEEKGNPYTYAMKYINETYGLRGTVTHITIT